MKLMRVSNYARENKVSTQYVYKLIKSNKIKAKNIDGVWFVVVED